MHDGAGIAIKKSEHGVQRLHTLRAPSRAQGLHWDDLRVFLEVARLGSLRAAAAAEGVSVNTVRARLAKLEAAYDAPLLRRSRKGSSVTDMGEEVVATAREMQFASQGLTRQAHRNVLVTPGQVRLFSSEGLGLLWLTPRLDTLHDMLGHITVSLSIGYDLRRDRSAQMDVALAFQKPTDPEMIITKLATLHFMMFASAGYLQEHGTPLTLDEMRQHRLIEQAAPGVNSWLLDFVLGTERPEGLVPIRTNSSLAQLWAVSSGAGIAPMPTFVRAITRSVIPIGPPLNLRFDLFCTYHANARRSPAIEATVAWLRRCFDPQLYPWFRSEFVHPDGFPDTKENGQVASLFDTLVDPRTKR